MTRFAPRPALLAALPLLAACIGGDPTQDLGAEVDGVPDGAATMMVAGGCFWCVESDFEDRDDVYEVVSGYAGGTSATPTYETYAADGHREVARIYYDPDQTDYASLARFFLRTVDPTDVGGQFCDRGFGYTTAIYYETEEERRVAEAAVAEAEQVLGEPVVTPVEEASAFTPAEAYHQDFYEKSPVRYKYYRNGCGRDQRLAELWGEAAMGGTVSAE